MKSLVSGVILFVLGLLVSCAEKNVEDNGMAFGTLFKVQPLKDQIAQQSKTLLPPKARECYAKQLKKIPVEGKVLMGYVVSLSGKVTGAKVKESTLLPKNPALEQCLQNAVLTTAFTPLKADKSGLDGEFLLEVEYPFVFRQGN